MELASVPKPHLKLLWCTMSANGSDFARVNTAHYVTFHWHINSKTSDVSLQIPPHEARHPCPGPSLSPQPSHPLVAGSDCCSSPWVRPCSPPTAPLAPGTPGSKFWGCASNPHLENHAWRWEPRTTSPHIKLSPSDLSFLRKKFGNSFLTVKKSRGLVAWSASKCLSLPVRENAPNQELNLRVIGHKML